MSRKANVVRHGANHAVGGSDPIPGFGGSGPTMVWGALLNDAGVIAGTGFTVSWDNNGGAPSGKNFYTVYFDAPFTNPPVVQLTPNNDSPATLEGRYQVSLVTRNTDYIVVRTDDIDDADDPTQDGGFDFLAVEPGV